MKDISLSEKLLAIEMSIPEDRKTQRDVLEKAAVIATMHDEIVELLSSIPCIKCGLFTACNMSTKIDAIYDALKRAKAL